MTKRSICLLLMTTTLSLNSYAITLEESYQATLKNYQNKEFNDARIQSAKEQASQAKGSYLPTITAQGSYQKVDGLDDQKTVNINLKSNLFNGGIDSDKVENAKKNVEISKNLAKLDQIKIYLQVVSAYFDYVIAVNDYKNFELLEMQARDRVSDLSKRINIGKSRKGELYQAQAQLASVDVAKKNANGLVKQYAENLKALTGLNHNSYPVYGLKSNNKAESKDYYVQKMLNREDIINKKLNLEQAQTSYQIAKKHFMPSLDVNANAYALREGGSSSARNSDWDVGLTLAIPLYEGGIANAAKREELHKVSQETIALANLEKDVVLEVSAKYEQFLRYQDQIKANEVAYKSAKQSYEESLKDYALGIISNLDVITSLNLYLNNKKEYEKSQLMAEYSLKVLEASSGMIPERL